MNKHKAKQERLARRHRAVRGKISGTPARPRLCVTRSNANIYAQVIDDVAGKTLVSASTLSSRRPARSAPTRKLPPSWASLLVSAPSRLASLRFLLTAVATSTMVAWPPSPTVPVAPAWSSRRSTNAA